MRGEIPIVVLDSDGDAVAGASITINGRGVGLATVYQFETGVQTLANPLTTDGFGRVSGWLERGAYDVVISAAGLTAYTEQIDVAPARDGAIDAGWIPNQGIPMAKLDLTGGVDGEVLRIQGGVPVWAPFTIGAADIATDAVGQDELAAGAVGLPEMIDPGAGSAFRVLRRGSSGLEFGAPLQRATTLAGLTAYEGAAAELRPNTANRMLIVFDASLNKWVSLETFTWSFTAVARGTIWRGGVQRGDDYHNENAITDLGPWLPNKVWRDAGLRPQIRAFASIASVSPQGGRYHLPIRGASFDGDAGPSGIVARPVDFYGSTSDPTYDMREQDWTQFDIGDYEYMNINGSIAGNHVSLAGGAREDFWELRWVSA